MLTRPMLAATARVPEDIWYPCCATPKIDGIRGTVKDGQLLSRRWTPIRNRHVQAQCSALPDGFDGELCLNYGTFHQTSGAMRRFDGEPIFTFMVFDWYHPTLGYLDRVARLKGLDLIRDFEGGIPSFVEFIYPTHLWCLEDLLKFEAVCLEAGYEGIMTRSAVGPYMCRRSRLSDQNLVKFKRFTDSEAIVLSVHEGKTNLNPVVQNAFGYATRPGGMGGKVPRGTMGYLVCRDTTSGVLVRLGSGFDDETRAEVFEDVAAYIGKLVKYRYQEVGTEGAPRFPRFLGWRDHDDV